MCLDDGVLVSRSENQVILEFHSLDGSADITGTGAVRLHRIEHEGGGGGPFALGGSVNFGLDVYDVTGSFRGAPRQWNLLEDLTVRNGGHSIFILEKNVIVHLGTHVLSVDRLRLGVGMITGLPGSSIIVGSGVPVIEVPCCELSATAKYEPDGTYVWSGP